MRDQKAILCLRRGCPAAHAGVGPRLVEINRRAAAALMGAGRVRHPFFMRAPAQFCGLHALGEEALH